MSLETNTQANTLAFPGDGSALSLGEVTGDQVTVSDTRRVDSHQVGQDTLLSSLVEPLGRERYNMSMFGSV